MSRNVAFFWKLLLVKRVDVQIYAVFGISKRVESTSSYIFSCSVCLPVLIVNLYIFFSYARYVLLVTYLQSRLKICVLAFCLFVFLALQPIVVVFSQLGSGL